MLAGPPAQLTLSSDPGCERLAVTNGAEAASRLLLSGAALQLMDEHGNASAVPRQSVRVSLQWPPEDGGAPPLIRLQPARSRCVMCMCDTDWTQAHSKAQMGCLTTQSIAGSHGHSPVKKLLEHPWDSLWLKVFWHTAIQSPAQCYGACLNMAD